MIRTTKQLEAQLKDGYKVRSFGYKVTGTVASLIKQAEKLGLLK